MKFNASTQNTYFTTYFKTLILTILINSAPTTSKDLVTELTSRFLAGIEQKIDFIKSTNQFTQNYNDLKNKFCSVSKTSEYLSKISKNFKINHDKNDEEFRELQRIQEQYEKSCNGDLTPQDEVAKEIQVTDIPNYISKIEENVKELQGIHQKYTVEYLENNVTKTINSEKTDVEHLVSLKREFNDPTLTPGAKLACNIPSEFYKHSNSQQFVILSTGYTRSTIKSNCLRKSPHAKLVNRSVYKKFSDKNQEFESFVEDMVTVYKVESSDQCLWISEFEGLGNVGRKSCEKKLMLGICMVELPSFCDE